MRNFISYIRENDSYKYSVGDRIFWRGSSGIILSCTEFFNKKYYNVDFYKEDTSYYISENDISLDISYKNKRIKKLDIDPFDEEDWGSE